MRTNTTHSEKRTDALRPKYILLGTDAHGFDHVWRSDRDRVTVIRDGRVVHVEQLTDATVDAYVDAYAEARGWADRRYGRSLAEFVTDALEADA